MGTDVDHVGHRLDRIEVKLDKLGESFIALVRTEEQVFTLFKKVENYEVELRTLRDRTAALEMSAFGRGLFFRWLDRGAMATIGAAAAYALQNVGG